MRERGTVHLLVARLGPQAIKILPLVEPRQVRQSAIRSQTERGKTLRQARKKFATCVDAPLGAREIFESGTARGRVLTCVRPLLRRVPCRGPRWESGDQVQIRPTRLKRLSQSGFSRSRHSTVRHPSPLTFPLLDSLA